MPAYLVEGLSRVFPGERGRPGIVALEKAGFRVEAGEILVILGATGAGKTTLLRLLAGLEKADAGRISEDGSDISMLPPHRRDMAMVFQNFSLYPRLSVSGNLAFPLRAKVLGHSEGEIGERVRRVAATLGIEDKLERMPHELSGGELQRVALGRALVRQPKLFLLDEPLASLDAKLRERMVVEIHRLQRSLGTSMVYVTHDHSEAMGLADRILVMDRGRVLQAGRPEDVYRYPEDSRVARMLGRPAINIFSPVDSARLGLPDSTGRLVGIRPESWRVTADSKGPALAAVVEHLGSRTVVVLDVQGISLRATVAPSSRVKPGDRFRLSVDPSDILFLER